MSVLLIDPNNKQEKTKTKKDNTDLDRDKNDTELAPITDHLTKDKEERISQEVPLSPETQMMMSIKAYLSNKSGFVIDGPVSVDICASFELAPGTMKFVLLVRLQDFEQPMPGSSHICSLGGKFCHLGCICWSPSAIAADGLLPAGDNAPRLITRTFRVTIDARTLAKAQEDYRKMAKRFSRRGIQGVFDATWPRITTSCFVTFNAVLFVQTGDTNWRSIEAHSEAAIYKPAPLRVEGIQPKENLFSLFDSKKNQVIAVLNRPFNEVYDHLDGAELLMQNGSTIAIENKEFHGDKIHLDLSDCIRDAAFIVYYAMPWPRFAGARIRLWGRSNCGGEPFDCGLGFGFRVQASSAPSKEERRQRRYSEIEDEFFE